MAVNSGLSKRGVERMHRVLAQNVERGDVPGFVALASRHDDVHVEIGGTLSFDGEAPMRRDTIFRMASLTKLVAAAAAMMLVEDCALRLDDPIDRWIPELANRRVLKTLSSEIDDTVPAARSITVRDLLTFRMGFGSVMAPPNTYPIQRYIREYRIGGDGPFRPARAPATDEWIRALGSLPLIAQPGARWMYQVSADVLGVLIMRVSGKSLGAFMRERIFEPLGMRDTAFHVPGEKRDRLPTCYTVNTTSGQFEIYDGSANSDWGAEPPFESASSGLASTLDDFLAFCRMMLDQGRHGRDQLLSRASVELMTSDQMTPDQRAAAFPFLDDCTSWGLGFAVDIRRGEIFQNPGRYWWTGGTGTAAYVDPTEKMIGILLTQRMMGSPEPPRIYNDVLTTTYAAMA